MLKCVKNRELIYNLSIFKELVKNYIPISDSFHYSSPIWTVCRHCAFALLCFIVLFVLDLFNFGRTQLNLFIYIYLFLNIYFRILPRLKWRFCLLFTVWLFLFTFNLFWGYRNRENCWNILTVTVNNVLKSPISMNLLTNSFKHAKSIVGFKSRASVYVGHGWNA